MKISSKKRRLKLFADPDRIIGSFIYPGSVSYLSIDASIEISIFLKATSFISFSFDIALLSPFLDRRLTSKAILAQGC